MEDTTIHDALGADGLAFVVTSQCSCSCYLTRIPAAQRVPHPKNDRKKTMYSDRCCASASHTGWPHLWYAQGSYNPLLWLCWVRDALETGLGFRPQHPTRRLLTARGP
jgi:hypothetical protein